MRFDKISMEDYLKLVSKYEELEKELITYALEVMKRKNELTPDGLEKPYYYDSDAYVEYMSADGVSVRVEEYWPYGGHETHNYLITLDELFSSSWEEDYKKKIAIDLHIKELDRLKKQEEKLEKERLEYERLKKKFEINE